MAPTGQAAGVLVVLQEVAGHLFAVGQRDRVVGDVVAEVNVRDRVDDAVDAQREVRGRRGGTGPFNRPHRRRSFCLSGDELHVTAGQAYLGLVAIYGDRQDDARQGQLLHWAEADRHRYGFIDVEIVEGSRLAIERHVAPRKASHGLVGVVGDLDDVDDCFPDLDRLCFHCKVDL